jgi:prepilin-type N-terminal cleavage/methylation domain-containing protein
VIKVLRSGKENINQREEGFSLVELLISIFLLSIASMLVVTLLLSATTTMRNIEVRSLSDHQSQLMASILEADLRSATALTASAPVIASAGGLTLTTYRLKAVNGAPERHRYYMTEDKLMRGVLVAGGTTPNWTWTGTETVNQIGQYVRNATATPIFTYYDQSNVLLTTLASDADRIKIRKVAINIICDVDTQKPPGAYSTKLEVTLRNQR